MVKNLPCSAGNMGLIPGWGTETPRAAEQLSSWTTTTEPTHYNGRACTVPQQVLQMQHRPRVPQPEPEGAKHINTLKIKVFKMNLNHECEQTNEAGEKLINRHKHIYGNSEYDVGSIST